MENWCKEHETDWFKTAKMKAYAHPVKDASGATIRWCNRPEGEAAHPSTYENVPLVKEAVKMGAEVESVSPKPNDSSEMSKEDWAEKDTITRRSIERQAALYAAKDIAVAKMGQVGEEMTMGKILETAKRFATYLDTGE